MNITSFIRNGVLQHSYSLFSEFQFEFSKLNHDLSCWLPGHREKIKSYFFILIGALWVFKFVNLTGSVYLIRMQVSIVDAWRIQAIEINPHTVMHLLQIELSKLLMALKYVINLMYPFSALFLPALDSTIIYIMDSQKLFV